MNTRSGSDDCAGCKGTGLLSQFIFPDGGYEDHPCPDCAIERIASDILHCATSWDKDARLIGNVRAGDIAAFCTEALRSRKEVTASAERIRQAMRVMPSSKHGQCITFEGCDYILVEPDSLADLEDAVLAL